MLEEATDDALDADIVGEARDAGPQAAYAADDEIDLDAGIARDIEGIDQPGIDQRVELGPDLGRAPRLGMGDLLLDMVEQPLLERQGRDRDPLELLRLGVAGDEVEEPCRIAAQRRIGGEEGEVG